MGWYHKYLLPSYAYIWRIQDICSCEILRMTWILTSSSYFKLLIKSHFTFFLKCDSINQQVFFFVWKKYKYNFGMIFMYIFEIVFWKNGMQSWYWTNFGNSGESHFSHMCSSTLHDHIFPHVQFHREYALACLATCAVPTNMHDPILPHVQFQQEYELASLGST